MPAANSNVKQPQDRKPKQPQRFTFTGADGKQYKLPPSEEGAQKIPGRYMRDVSMAKGETERAQANLALGFATLEASGADEATLNALYDLPMNTTLEVVGEWMDYGADETEVPAGEDPDSSA